MKALASAVCSRNGSISSNQVVFGVPEKIVGKVEPGGPAFQIRPGGSEPWALS